MSIGSAASRTSGGTGGVFFVTSTFGALEIDPQLLDGAEGLFIELTHRELLVQARERDV